MRGGGLGPLCLAPWAPEDSGNVLGWGSARGWRWASKTEGGAGPPGDVWVRPRPGLGERPPGACSPRAPRGLVRPAGPGCAPPPGQGGWAPCGGQEPGWACPTADVGPGWASPLPCPHRLTRLLCTVGATWLCERLGALALGGPASWLPGGAGSRAGPLLHFGSFPLWGAPGTGFCLSHRVV